MAPYAPHLAEELWNQLGHNTSITNAEFPLYEEKYLAEDEFEYPISFNGKARFKMSFPAAASKDDIQEAVLKSEKTQKWLEGMKIRKIIIVPKKIVNLVIGK